MQNGISFYAKVAIGRTPMKNEFAIRGQGIWILKQCVYATTKKSPLI